MSAHFNCVINCEFPADLRYEYVELLLYLTTPDYQLDPELVFEEELFNPIDELSKAGNNLRPYSELSMSRFVASKGDDGHVLSYVLQYIEYYIHDDTLANFHALLLMWIAKYCVPGFIGYWGQTMNGMRFESAITIFQAQNGQLIAGRLDLNGTFQHYD